MTYTLGIDIGTTSICALARNTETGKPDRARAKRIAVDD